MPSLGPTELILVLAIALIVFGPGKLTELGSSLGTGLREFRRATSSDDEAPSTVAKSAKVEAKATEAQS